MVKQTVIGVSHSCSLEQSCTGTECTGSFLFQMGSACLVLAAIQLNMIKKFLNVIPTLLCTQCIHYNNIDFYKNKTHKLLSWILKLFILKMACVIWKYSHCYGFVFISATSTAYLKMASVEHSIF